MVEWIRGSLQEDLSIANLSRRANMSPRSFIRHFTVATGMAPGEWILNERLALARELLETSSAPIEDIAHTCGLGTAATLRHHFRRRLKTTPTAHRLQFHRDASYSNGSSDGGTGTRPRRNMLSSSPAPTR